ncbi:WxL domain-containing protein [Brochothrix thermosphacta]|uniref:WxL domain-containing protein n=1 Tax=Brochothrix thermosphacta TaxID=2756 RepID=A0A2X0R5E0_BROTH|nr:WxL domain-containing protein [Brochothrix thermosphacta]SPP29360.1 conserved exported hypothetical protein [Brochothrix thermosphacta]
MKKISLVTAATLAALTVGGATVDAASYPNSTEAKTEAKIKFLEDTSVTPVDPKDPTIPVDPVDPPNPNVGELMITYASDLDFGDHEKMTNNWKALGDEMKDGSFMAPFVSMKDSRGSEREGWSLQAKLDAPFTTSKGTELTGAELKYSNMTTASTQTGAPTVVSGEVNVNQVSAQEIMSADVDQGVGNWAVGLGSLDGTDAKATTNGVALTAPTTTAKDTDTYKTTVTYTLVADPTK